MRSFMTEMASSLRRSTRGMVGLTTCKASTIRSFSLSRSDSLRFSQGDRFRSVAYTELCAMMPLRQMRHTLGEHSLLERELSFFFTPYTALDLFWWLQWWYALRGCSTWWRCLRQALLWRQSRLREGRYWNSFFINNYNECESAQASHPNEKLALSGQFFVNAFQLFGCLKLKVKQISASLQYNNILSI